MPTVSVIIPNYNHAKYLQHRIESVLNQTYQDFEVIILDDCSSDNSLEIIHRYSVHPKIIHIIVNEVNSRNTFIQWKKGIEKASGEYIWIAESDDFADEHFLEVLTDILERNPNVGLAYCKSISINENNELFLHGNKWLDRVSKTKWEKDYINSGIEECSSFMSIQCTIANASSVLFRKVILKKVDFGIGRFNLVGDWYIYINMLLISDIAYSAKPLNYYRHHNQNVRSTVALVKAVYEMCVVIDYLAKKLPIKMNDLLGKRNEEIILKWLTALGKMIKEKKFNFSSHLNIFYLMQKNDSLFLIRILKVVFLYKILRKKFHFS